MWESLAESLMLQTLGEMMAAKMWLMDKIMKVNLLHYMSYL